MNTLAETITGWEAVFFFFLGGGGGGGGDRSWTLVQPISKPSQ